MAFHPLPGQHPDCEHKLHYRFAVEAGEAAAWAAARNLPGRCVYICRCCDLYALTSRAPS